MEKRDVTTARLTKNKIFLSTNISPLANAMELGYTVEETIVFKNRSDASIYFSELLKTMHNDDYVPAYAMPNPKLKRETVGFYKDTVKYMSGPKDEKNRFSESIRWPFFKEYLNEVVGGFDEFCAQQKNIFDNWQHLDFNINKDFKSEVKWFEESMIRDIKTRPKTVNLTTALEIIKNALDSSLEFDKIQKSISKIIKQDKVPQNFTRSTNFIEFDTGHNLMSFKNENDETEIGELIEAKKQPNGSVHWILKKV